MKSIAQFSLTLSSLLVAPFLLTGCDKLGLVEDPVKTAATQEAEGKAVGGGCRNAGRGLEDCYKRNPKALKAAVFAGWKEMNDYMTQNKIEVIPPPPEPKESTEEEPAAAGDKGEETEGKKAKHT